MEDNSSVGEPISIYSTSISTPYPLGLYKKIQTPNAHKKGFNSLPKLNNSQQFDIYRLFCLHANLNNIIAKIPTTLLRISNTNLCYLVQNNKYGAIITRLCTDDDFFAEIPDKNDNENPVCCYKILGKPTQFLYTKESAVSLWNSSTETSDKMQIFVQPRSKPSSLTRAYWRFGGRTKFYLIANKTRPLLRRRTAIPTDYTKRSMTLTPKNIRSNMNLPLFKIINRNTNECMTPATERPMIDHCPSLSSFRNFGNFTERFSGEDQFPDQNTNPIVNTRASDGIMVIEDTVKVPEIENMVDKIVSFLRKQVYKEEELREITFDFILSKEKKWTFLDCVEISLKNHEIKLEIGEINLGEPSQVKRAISFMETKPEVNIHVLKALSTERGAELNSVEEFVCPFSNLSSQRSSKAHHPPQISQSSSHISTKHVKIVAKDDPVLSLKPSNLARIKNLKKQSIKAYQNRSLTKKLTIMDQIHQDNQAKKVKIEETEEKNDFYNTSKSLWDNKYDVHIKKCFTDAIRKIDEMNMNTELLKVRSRNLVEAYGGDEFWNKFIISLYKRILSSDDLKQHFLDSNMKMIFKGMFKVFNGCATFEFRRKIKVAHERLGIPEEDFNLYSQMFEDTLNEFNISDVDKQVIMAQIRSMKCLICKPIMP
ncbi:unnamed protein product [Blepharisma stoltei]|uniref:Globin family profile domain-containing protein n=1 Tax=Blepharisma stoltei TaxID=1481888 RepID=A0AAU9IX70_9CILI|nr:unnamed protein product [Blepharisma stoltei]